MSISIPEHKEYRLDNTTDSGYASAVYAHSLREFGEPICLGQSGGWILRRAVKASQLYDGMGCYPVFSCPNWEGLRKDFEDIQDSLLSLALVTDVFGGYNEQWLKDVFVDLVVPFKTHFIVDLSGKPEDFVTKHHRYYGRRAERHMEIFSAENPKDWLENWNNLYSNLIARHQVKGMAAFSPFAFKNQFEVPGLHVLVAQKDNRILGMQLWYLTDDYGYHHLSAYSEEGYKMRASYGLLWYALDLFKHMDVKSLDLGGSAGLNDNESGLAKFKSGWSNRQLTAYLCGRIFNNEKYIKLASERGHSNSDYFPAYRQGEFA